MIFATPVPFAEAVQSRAVRSILPTSLGSAELAQIDAAILERATFSARVINAEYLQTISDVVDDYVNGRVNLATARLRLKEKLASLGYVPEPGTEGTLLDHASDERTNLVLRMNAQFATGYGNWLHDQQEPILNFWPAQEFLRVGRRMVPRTDWPERFTAAGGTVFPDGRMIALRNTPIWTNLSRFGLPYPPFDFNSGMGVELIDREEAMSLKLIDRDTQLKPEDRGFNDDLRFSADVRDAALRQALIESVDESGVPWLDFVGDVLTTIGGGT